ncbi:MAG: Flp1 family type IVb pilin [Oscillospiraceae bacterium]
MKKLKRKIDSALLRAKLSVQNRAAEVLTSERGDTNIIAIILILVVVIGLVIIFRDQLTSLVQRIFGSINEDVDGVLNS